MLPCQSSVEHSWQEWVIHAVWPPVCLALEMPWRNRVVEALLSLSPKEKLGREARLSQLLACGPAIGWS